MHVITFKCTCGLWHQVAAGGSIMCERCLETAMLKELPNADGDKAFTFIRAPGMEMIPLKTIMRDDEFRLSIPLSCGMKI